MDLRPRTTRLVRVVAPLLVVSAALAACGTAPALHQYGAMRPVMREGRTEPRVELFHYASLGFYGVGAMSGLDGEVTIDDGAVWVSRVEGDDIATTGPQAEPDAFATLLTVGCGRDWQQITLVDASDGPAIEDAIATLAADHGMPVEGPLLVTIEGCAAQVGVHVVAGACPHATPDADAWRLTLEGGAPIRIVGVFAAGRAGELTHHGTRIHLHAIFDHEGRPATAHIDSMTLEPGALLRIATPTSR